MGDGFYGFQGFATILFTQLISSEVNTVGTKIATFRHARWPEGPGEILWDMQLSHLTNLQIQMIQKKQ